MLREVPYSPRPWFFDFHRREKRWACLVCHRRAGKTVAVLQDTIAKAAYNPRPHPRYAYIAPLLNQARQIAWTYLKEFTKNIASKVSESGLYVELDTPSQPRVTLYGADNPDAFRGLYFDGVNLDEFGNMAPSIWTTILLPALVDRRGWATFMGTPNGPNHFRDMYYDALENQLEWFVQMSKVTDTNIIPEEELAMMKRMMTPEEFLQEMMCSFEAATRGAFYAREMAAAEEDGRVVEFDLDESPLHWVFDLGGTDATAGFGWQNRPDGYGIRINFSDNDRPVSYYAEQIEKISENLGVPRGKLYLPHDARAKTLGSRRSVVEQFVDNGIFPQIVPKLDFLDGIAAARLVFPQTWFHPIGAKNLILALKSYHREWDEQAKVFKKTAYHDWSSNYADSYRYFAIVAKKTPARPTKPVSIVQKTANYLFSLEDLYRDRRAPSMRIP